MNLPFLKERKLPTLRKQSGVSMYGFSEDDELIEHALDEIIQAIEMKDHKKLIEAVLALVHCIKNRENSDATHPLENS